jgi:hypothetical protein
MISRVVSIRLIKETKREKKIKTPHEALKTVPTPL